MKMPCMDLLWSLDVWMCVGWMKIAYRGIWLRCDSKVFVISPVSSNSFIEFARLRSIDKARVRLVFEVPSCFAISSSVIPEFPFWEVCPCPPPTCPCLYPHNLTYSDITFRCFDSLFLERWKIAATYYP